MKILGQQQQGKARVFVSLLVLKKGGQLDLWDLVEKFLSTVHF